MLWCDMWSFSLFSFSRLAPNIISPLVSPLKALVPPSLLQKHGSPSSHSQSPNGQQFSGIPNTPYAPFPNQSVQQGSQGNSSLFLFFATFLIPSWRERIYFGFSYLANTNFSGNSGFKLDWGTYRWKFSDRSMLWYVIIMGKAVPTADLLHLCRFFSRRLLATHLSWLVIQPGEWPYKSHPVPKYMGWGTPWQCPAQSTHSDAQDMELDKEKKPLFHLLFGILACVTLYNNM